MFDLFCFVHLRDLLKHSTYSWYSLVMNQKALPPFTSPFGPGQWKEQQRCAIITSPKTNKNSICLLVTLHFFYFASILELVTNARKDHAVAFARILNFLFSFSRKVYSYCTLFPVEKYSMALKLLLSYSALFSRFQPSSPKFRAMEFNEIHGSSKNSSASLTES